jgi:hypothetical protein
MALTTDESYCTVAFADEWHANRGNTVWAALTTPQKEQALRKATDYLEQVYTWKGTKVNNIQVLSFPRYGIYVDGYLVNSDLIPLQVQSATAEMAVRASQGDLAPDLTQDVKREKVDVLEIEYKDGSVQYVRYRSIDNLLKWFVSGVAGSVSKMVIRT